MTDMERPAPPRWDGQRLVFELNMDDGMLVRCAISRLALLSIGDGGPSRATDPMARFTASRARIEAAAHAKLRGRATPPLGLLHIWQDDILDPSPGASPCSMQAPMRRG